MTPLSHGTDSSIKFSDVYTVIGSFSGYCFITQPVHILILFGIKNGMNFWTKIGHARDSF